MLLEDQRIARGSVAEELLVPPSVRGNHRDERPLGRQLYCENEAEKRYTRRGIPMTLNKETTRTCEERQGNLRYCEHDYPMLVVETEEGGYYYARCIRCLSVGPERLSGEAARKALRVLGVRDVTAATRR